MAANDERNEINTRFGQLLSRRRKKAGVSQEKLAKILGLTRTSVTNIESGRQPIQLHTLYAIADAIGVNPTDLMPNVSKYPNKIIPSNERERVHLESLSVATSHWLAKLSSEITSSNETETEDGKVSTKD